MKTPPILFLIFNRPELTRKVFDVICKVKPTHLFIAADGPRIDKIGESALCNETRNLILKNITWPCDIKTLFRKNNLGCGIAVSEAITWFFNNVEYGIILEDDTVPELTFFPFCNDLLERYKKENRIMHISGNSFHSLKAEISSTNSYYYSKFPFNWGWATWKRAWEKYDYNIIQNSNQNTWFLWLQNNFKEKIIIEHWTRTLMHALSQKESFTWDYQWYLTIWKNNGISILPQRNLVKNIGWSLNATHTNDPNHHLGKLKTYKIKFPLESPENRYEYSFEINNFKNYYTVLNKSNFYFKYCHNNFIKFYLNFKELIKKNLTKFF